MVKHWLLACAALVVFTFSNAARAQNDAGDERSYGNLIKEAVSEFSRGNFAEAYTLFGLAHQKRPNARTYRGLAIVEYELRDYVSAVEHFEAALAEARNPLSKSQRAETEALLERARRFVGHFTVRLEAEGASLTVDGRAVELGENGELALSSGTYRLVARAPDHTDGLLTLVVRGGEREEITMRPQPIQASPPPQAIRPTPPPADAAVTTVEPELESSSDGPPTSALVALAIGGAGIATFAVAGGLALAKDGELQDCSPGCDRDEVDSMKTAMVVADVGLAVGVLGAALGAYFWLSDESAEATQANREALYPLVGPGLAGMGAELSFW